MSVYRWVHINIYVIGIIVLVTWSLTLENFVLLLPLLLLLLLWLADWFEYIHGNVTFFLARTEHNEQVCVVVQWVRKKKVYKKVSTVGGAVHIAFIQAWKKFKFYPLFSLVLFSKQAAFSTFYFCFISVRNAPVRYFSFRTFVNLSFYFPRAV